MSRTDKTSPARQFDTLVSPHEYWRQPHWLQQASPPLRRRLQEDAQAGRQSRHEATRLFAELQSLAQYNRVELKDLDSAAVTPDILLAIHQQHALPSPYTRHLKNVLDSAGLRSAKEHAYKATLREELTIANIRADVDKHGEKVIEWFLSGFNTGSVEFAQPGIYIQDQLTVCSSLQWLNGLAVPDILLFGADQEDALCVAFVPGHPRHPLKQYRTRAMFFASLRHDLLDPDFQRYFSRFIALKHQAQTFAAWTDRNRLLTLPMQSLTLTQGIRSFVVDQMTARIVDDARFLIPIDADQAAGLHYLGPSFARAIEEHLMLGAGAGISPGEENEGRAPSDWVAALRVVKVEGAKGWQRWLPDLGDYQIDRVEPATAAHDAQGIYRIEGRQAIAINNAFYCIEENTEGTWHILHPKTSDAYRPVLQHNGAGAWHHSLEQPQHWDRLTLLRRLGPLASGFDDERLLQLGRVCDVSNARLRRVYQLDEPVPALLIDVLQRARIHDEVDVVMKRIAQGQPVDSTDLVPQLKEFYRVVAIQTGQPAPGNRGRRGTDPTPPPTCESSCAAPPALTYAQWESVLTRAIAAQRYELAQLDTDHAVQELRRLYPLMPIVLAEQFLLSSAEHLRASLPNRTEPLPLNIAEQAQNLQYDARLTRALEGFMQPSAINNDTFVLALRLLEHLEGWIPGTALLLRVGDRFGTPLGSIGTPDVDTTSIYLDDDEGWSTATSDQILLAQDMTEYGFYRALLYATGQAQRTRLGFGLNEPERLHQALREQALARPERARLLLGMPVQRSWLTRVPASSVQRAPSVANLGLARHEPVMLRLGRLITEFTRTPTRRAARDYLDGLLQSNEPIAEHVTMLEQQYQQLRSATDAWLAQATPNARVPRAEAVRQLRYAWQGRIAPNNGELVFVSPLIGELPPLPVTMPNVVSLTIGAVTQIEGLSILLQRLPNLRRLELVDLPLSQIPDSLTALASLRLLEISGCEFSPFTLRALGQMRHLTTLILNGMRVSPWEWGEEDMRAMTAGRSLQSLSIQRSHAHFGPGVFAVLATLPDLLSLNLCGNELTLSAEDAAAVGRSPQLNRLDLSGNPLGRLPDITNLRHLEELDLSHPEGTVDEWPAGLENLPGILNADLRGMAITDVPEGAGRTRGLRMSRAHLPEAMRDNFELERNSIGNYAIESDSYSSESSGESSQGDIDSEPEAPVVDASRTLIDAQRLLEGMATEDHARAMQLLQSEDHGVIEFFALLLKIDVSREASRPQAQLRTRIQALIRGAFKNELRQALQDQARQAVSCVDRDALVFSQMENLLNADLALSKASDIDAAAELIAMATSHWRVLRLREYVVANISAWRNAGNIIDYSEIELYFRIALAQRLNLRDQPGIQEYTSYTRWVTPQMLDAAHSAVLATPTDNFASYLHEQPYWQRYLDFALPARVGGIQRWRDRIGEYLDAASTDEELPPLLTDDEQEHLRQVLISSAQLGPFEPLPSSLRLNSQQYRDAYTALLQRVDMARRQLTDALLTPQPGPSSRH